MFFVNLPVGAVVLLLARRYLPAPSRAPSASAPTLDPLGVVLLGAAVVCILVPFIEQRTWHSPLRLALFPLAAVLLVAVGAARAPLRPHPRAARQPRPVPDPLLRARRRASGSSTSPGSSATFFILTQYLQLGLHYPAWKAGLAATPFALGGALIASLGSRQVLRRGRKLVAFGLATVIVGLAARLARGARRSRATTSRCGRRCRC